jgi:hypothetical protein
VERSGLKALRALPLERWAAQRLQDLLNLLSGLNPQIRQLAEAIEGAAQENPRAQLLMTQPGVGPITALVGSARGLGALEAIHVPSRCSAKAGVPRGGTVAMMLRRKVVTKGFLQAHH